jgi:hypothetical protein
MYYVTEQLKDKETLISVCGNEKNAKEISEGLIKYKYTYKHTCGFSIRSLNQLFDNKVKIPDGLKWIVESDRKHQEREVESRTKNLVDDNALSFRKKEDLAAQRQQDNESFFPPQK